MVRPHRGGDAVQVRRIRFGGDDWSYPDEIPDPRGKYVLYTDAVKMARDAMGDGWRMRDGGCSYEKTKAEAARRYKEE
jgi:hypothetical protein